MKKNLDDNARALAIAAVSGIPGVGGIIASLIDSYIPSSQEEAIEKSFACFKEKLEDLAGRIDAEIVRKEDFAELYNSYKRTTSHTNREEKLRAAANILANFFLKPVDPAKSSFEELDHLLHCVDTLSAGAIAVLGAARKIPHQVTRGDRAFHFSDLANQLAGWDKDLIMSLASELRGLNLLHITEGMIESRDYESYAIRVTPVGARLADRFIEGEM